MLSEKFINWLKNEKPSNYNNLLEEYKGHKDRHNDLIIISAASLLEWYGEHVSY
jgi:hypothetical protein